MDQTANSENAQNDLDIVSRERLYEEIWSEPAMHLAEKYGVSGSFLARVCARLRVPRPRPGYWNKLSAGKAPPRPPLPEAEAGDELHWNPANVPLSRSRATRKPQVSKSSYPSPLPAPATDLKASTDILSSTASKVALESDSRHPVKRVPATHPLIEGVVGLIPLGKITEEGHYRPRKRLLPDLITSPKQLDAIVRLANKLYRLLEARGHRVRMSHTSDRFQRKDPDPFPPDKQHNYHDSLWYPERPTVVYIDSIAIGLSLYELCETVEMLYVAGEYVPVAQVSRTMKTRIGNHTWTTKKLVPSGEICLQAYSPYSGTTWNQQWRGKPNVLTNELDEIVSTLEAQPKTIRHLIEDARLAAEKRAREWEEKKQQYRLEEQAKRRAKALESSHAELLAIIEEWNEHKRIAAFFDEAISLAAQTSEEIRSDIEQRIAEALKFLNITDPLSRLKQWRSPEEIYESLPKSHWEKD